MRPYTATTQLSLSVLTPSAVRWRHCHPVWKTMLSQYQQATPILHYMLQEEISDGESSANRSVDRTSTPAAPVKYARGKMKKMTPEQLAARRRRLWVMIMKKEIPRVIMISTLSEFCLMLRSRDAVVVLRNEL